MGAAPDTDPIDDEEDEAPTTPDAPAQTDPAAKIDPPAGEPKSA